MNKNIEKIRNKINKLYMELSQEYLSSDNNSKRRIGKWIEYNYVYEYVSKSDEQRPPGKFTDSISKLSEEERNCLYEELKNIWTTHAKNLINLEREEKRFLNFFTGDDEKDIQSVFNVLFNASTFGGMSRKQRRKKKIKSIPWNELPDTLQPDGIFVEIITNEGKKVAKKHHNDLNWTDEKGVELDCKILKWRIK